MDAARAAQGKRHACYACCSAATPGQGSSKPREQGRSRASPGRPKAGCLKHSALVQRLPFPLIKTRFKRQRKARPVPAAGFVLTTPLPAALPRSNSAPQGPQQEGAGNAAAPESQARMGLAGGGWRTSGRAGCNQRPGSWGGICVQCPSLLQKPECSPLPTNRQGGQPVQ